jgi:hypothetical protein
MAVTSLLGPGRFLLTGTQVPRSTSDKAHPFGGESTYSKPEIQADEEILK